MKKVNGQEESLVKYFYKNFFNKYTKQYIVILIMLMNISMLSLLQPYLNIQLLDNALPNRNFKLILFLVLCFVILYIYNIIIGYIVQKKCIVLNNSLVEQMKKIIVGKLHHYFFDKCSQERSEKIVILREDVFALLNFANSTIISAIIQGVTLVCYAVFLCRYSFILTGIIFINAVVQVFITLKFVEPLRKSSEEFKKNAENEIGYISETFINMKTISSYCQVENSVRKYSSIIQSFKRISLKNYKIGMKQSILLQLTSLVSLIITILLGTYFIINDRLSIGVFVAFMTSSEIVKSSLSYLVSLNSSIQLARVSANRVYNVLTEYSGETSQGKITDIGTIKEIKFEQLNLHIKDKMLIKDFCYHIKENSKIVICGKNGSGKSTLFNTLLGYCSIDKNQIYLNQFDITDLSTEALRKRISIAFQQSHFFNGSLLDNICLSEEKDDTHEKIYEILDILYLREFVEALPDKLETQMDDVHSLFSGGELQKVGIARAIMRDADLYLFDESFSNIESKHKMKIFHKICEVLGDKIVIFISHDQEILGHHSGQVIHLS